MKKKTEVLTGISRIDAGLARSKVREDSRGTRIRHLRHPGDRYDIDWGLDWKIWTQLDTEEDAAWFGIWFCKRDLRMLRFMEGDLYFSQFRDAEAYDQELARRCDRHERAPSMITIDDAAVTAYYQDRSDLFVDPARGAAYRFEPQDEDTKDEDTEEENAQSI